MKIRTTRKGDVVIVAPIGNMTIGDGDIAFREAIHGVLAAGCLNVLVDLQHVGPQTLLRHGDVIVYHADAEYSVDGESRSHGRDHVELECFMGVREAASFPPLVFALLPRLAGLDARALPGRAGLHAAAVPPTRHARHVPGRGGGGGDAQAPLHGL